MIAIAKSLLGKAIFTRFGDLTGGIILETEAYAGVSDRASHAFNGRKTERNQAMYGAPGTAYVYLCYGIHSLLNAVTGPEGTPHAVLIRALQPICGIETMLQRRKKAPRDIASLCHGPGALTQALGISLLQNKQPLTSWPLIICDGGWATAETSIEAGPRIGVDYAGSDALLPYRFRLRSTK